MPPMRGVKGGVGYKRLSSQRVLPPLSGHRQRGSTQNACIAMPDDDLRQVSRGSTTGRENWRSGCEVESFGMGAAVMLGQGFTEGAGPVRDGVMADLAPCGHRANQVSDR